MTRILQSSTKIKTGTRYGYVIVVASFFIMLVVWGVYYAFGIFFKPLLAEFGWTRAMTSGAFSFSMIVYGVMGVVMGGMSDRYGPRLVLSICGFLFGLGYLLMSQISAVWQLYLFYGAIIGVAISGVYVSVASTVARWFVRRRGMAVGLVMSGVGIGAWMGPQAANWLISTYEWRTSYAILGVVVLVVVTCAAQFLKRAHDFQNQDADGGNMEKPVALPEGFSLREAIPTRQFWLIFGTYLCFGFSLAVILVHLAPHATDTGISAATAASILATLGAVSTFGKLLLGISTDKIGSKMVLHIALSLMFMSLLWLVPAEGVWKLHLFAGVFGFAYGGISAAQPPLVAALFGVKYHGVIMGTVNNGYTIGATVGPIIAGYIFDVAGTYRLAFIICAVLSLIGLGLTLFLTPVATREGRRKFALQI